MQASAHATLKSETQNSQEIYTNVIPAVLHTLFILMPYKYPYSTSPFQKKS